MKQKIPFLLSILCMSGGVLIAIFFGLNEQIFKDRIQAGLQKNTSIQSMQDVDAKASKIKSETDKNWRYYQRFHFHATGIGAMMMGLLLFLQLLGAPQKIKTIGSYLVSIGGLLYPFVWLFAAIYGPEMGRAEAKEAFAFFGYMGGVFLIGCLWIFVCAIRYPLQNK